MLIDTHAHIDFDDYENKSEIISNAQIAGIDKIIVPAVRPDKFENVISLLDENDCVYGAAGLHPSDAELFSSSVLDKIKTLSRHKKIIAIGECGLDYYWDKTFIDLQKQTFIEQIKLANELELTLIVHDREAHEDTLSILEEYLNPSTSVVMHCFSGSVEMAAECVKKGYYIALGGVVTFKNAKKPKEVAAAVPLEKLLLETDSPYLTPEPHRGQRNEPAYVKYVAQEIASLRDITFEEVAFATTQNALNAFGLQQ